MSKNIELLHIPPYTPEMNPIEQIWEELREKGFRNEVFQTLSKVVDRLCDDTMKAQGILHAEKGIVRLLTREEIPMKAKWDKPSTWLLMQQFTHAPETGGIKECARYVYEADASQAKYAKALAYRLYTISERKGWSQEAFAYNNLVVAWSDIQSVAANIRSTIPQQLSLFDEEE